MKKILLCAFATLILTGCGDKNKVVTCSGKVDNFDESFIRIEDEYMEVKVEYDKNNTPKNYKLKYDIILYDNITDKQISDYVEEASEMCMDTSDFEKCEVKEENNIITVEIIYKDSILIEKGFPSLQQFVEQLETEEKMTCKY